MSPDFTAAPSGFIHLTSVPTVMVSLSFGMLMIWAMGRIGRKTGLGGPMSEAEGIFAEAEVGKSGGTTATN